MEAVSLLLANGEVGAAAGLLERAPQLALRASYFEGMVSIMMKASVNPLIKPLTYITFSFVMKLYFHL